MHLLRLCTTRNSITSLYIGFNTWVLDAHYEPYCVEAWELELPRPPSRYCFVSQAGHGYVIIDTSSNNEKAITITQAVVKLVFKLWNSTEFSKYYFIRLLNTMVDNLPGLGVNIRSRVRFPALSQFKLWIRSETGYTQPREDNWVAASIKK